MATPDLVLVSKVVFSPTSPRPPLILSPFPKPLASVGGELPVIPRTRANGVPRWPTQQQPRTTRLRAPRKVRGPGVTSLRPPRATCLLGPGYARLASPTSPDFSFR